MKATTRWIEAVVAAVACTLIFGVPALHAETGGAASAAGTELALAAPAEECDSPAEVPRLDFGTPAATPASAHSGTFYICFGAGEPLCGCPAGTRCATEACGPFNNATCTFRLACVTSCQLSPGCQFIGHSCQDF